jgi:hypothetical protein
LGESSQDVEEEMPLHPPSAPKRKRRGNAPLVDTEVRRSPRILELNEGFKNHSICKDKNCLSCSSAPPNLKSKIVKKLATSFCKVVEENLSSKLMNRVKKLDKEKDKLEADGGNQKGKNGNSFTMMHKLTFDANCHFSSQLCNKSPSYFFCQNLWWQLKPFCGCVASELIICVQWCRLFSYSSHIDYGSVEKQFFQLFYYSNNFFQLFYYSNNFF